ncbi:multicopper oxidase domain-containing protein (plasmid) [Metabacillus halosaccharovorans]|nr:multicopper oxidase domain-containing protein [Metabacillus halosaccharovorans]MBU7595800.1 multicopper oxidase domain-containing protein [Metabacillus halosaccharovorans]MCM3441490.1 multicopper oxidase domain-containing protein [Metabacillus halosaccharovorans]
MIIPIHSHGYIFQVLGKNGVLLSGSPVMKDTLNLKHRNSMLVAFKAD